MQIFSRCPLGSLHTSDKLLTNGLEKRGKDSRNPKGREPKGAAEHPVVQQARKQGMVPGAWRQINVAEHPAISPLSPSPDL